MTDQRRTGLGDKPGSRRAMHPLRPLLPSDIAGLRELFAQSIDVLAADDYDEAQRLAWISRAEDGQAFAQRLMTATTLVVEREGELLGFASLKDNSQIDMLYVHPYAAGEGVGTTLVDALERIAAGRGTETMSVDASETAIAFFEALKYQPLRRNSVPIEDQWLTNTTMTKALKAIAPPTTGTPANDI